MKKLLVIALAVVMVFGLATSVALADDPSTVTIDWGDGEVTAPGEGWTGGYGSGWINVGVNTGDALAGFTSWGSLISGSYTATDFNNNASNTGIDSFSAYLNANVVNGYIDTGCERLTSIRSDAGERSWSYVGVVDGEASMAYRTTTYFANMTDFSGGDPGYQLAGNHNIVVTDADYYDIHRGIDDNRGNSAVLNAYGGLYTLDPVSATLDCMSARASDYQSLNFGCTEGIAGWGAPGVDRFEATGDGSFDLTATGNNSVYLPIYYGGLNDLGDQTGVGVTQTAVFSKTTTPGGSVTFHAPESGPAYWQVIANFTDGLDVDGYSITAY